MLLMILMALEVGTKKPICISSNIVYKIDRISNASSEGNSGDITESIYNCSSYKVPLYSAYFYENLESLNRRLSKLEQISSFLGLGGHVDLVIDERHPDLLASTNSVIFIGPGKLSEKNLESLILQTLFKANVKIANDKFREFLAGWFVGQYNEESALATIWSQSFEKLSALDQFRFNNYFSNQIKNKKVLGEASETESMLGLLSSDEDSVKTFKDNFTQSLKNFGLLSGDTKFDLVVQTDKTLKFDVDDLAALVKDHPEKRVLYRTSSGSFILPYMTKINSEDEKNIKADLYLLVLQDAASRLNFNSYFENTEKLIVLNSSAHPEQINFRTFFTADTDAFLASNKQFDFIQFHLPTLKYKLKELKTISNYFSFLKEKSTANLKQKSLGWASESWSSDVQGYKPLAVYDVIQYYRIN